MTWAPGMPVLIADRLVVDGGWFDRPGVTSLNLYRAPRMRLGDAARHSPGSITSTRSIPATTDHIVAGSPTGCSIPSVKINHALVLGGDEGIGKDTLLEPVKRAIGAWNFHEVSPTHMLGRFNSFLKSTVLRISEAARPRRGRPLRVL